MFSSNKTCTAKVTTTFAGDIDRLERWLSVDLRNFNKAKCKVLHLGQVNPGHIHRLCREVVGSSTEEKYLGGPGEGVRGMMMGRKRVPAS